MALKMVRVDGVGEVILEHSRRAKHINLSVKPFKGVRVAVPLRISLCRAEAVARSKIAWLKKHLARIAMIEERAIQHKNAHEFDPGAARSLLTRRAEELAAAHGFAHAKISIRNQKTRWGSCSANNNIQLNIRTSQLPLMLMDYVILHELTHTRIRNHGPLFWTEMDKVLDHPRRLDRQLNQYGFLLAQ